MQYDRLLPFLPLVLCVAPLVYILLKRASDSPPASTLGTLSVVMLLCALFVVILGAIYSHAAVLPLQRKTAQRPTVTASTGVYAGATVGSVERWLVRRSVPRRNSALAPR